MIKSFAHKGLEKFFKTGSTAGIQPKHKARLHNLLGYLHRARTVKDMDLPGFRLHPLKGDMRDLWSVTVNANWRVVFRFEGGNAYVVNYIDYH